MYIDLFPIYAYKHITVIIFTTEFLTYDLTLFLYQSPSMPLHFNELHDHNHTCEKYKFYNWPLDNRRFLQSRLT